MPPRPSRGRGNIQRLFLLVGAAWFIFGAWFFFYRRQLWIGCAIFLVAALIFLRQGLRRR